MKQTIAIQKQGLHALMALLLSVLLVIGLSLPPIQVAQSFADDTGTLEIVYTSELPQISDDNALYSLGGAQFKVYTDYECTQYIGTLVTDSSGHAYMNDLTPRRYFIHEDLPSQGFALTNRLYQAEVAATKTIAVDASAVPMSASPDVLVQELNVETSSAAGSSGLSLGNAQYTISYYDSFNDDKILATPTRTWNLQSNSAGQIALKEDYLIDGSPLYFNADNKAVMPIGHYTISMTKAPTGYTTPQAVLSCNVEQPTEATNNPIISIEPLDEDLQVIRGDLMFRKVDEFGTPLADIPFLLTQVNSNNEVAAESHVVLTDEFGDFFSSSEYMPHTQYTNANDEAVIALVDGSYKLDEDKLSRLSGVWFSQDELGNRSNPNDSLGALPYGSYILQELPCSKNEGMNLSTVQFAIYQDGLTVQLDNIVNTKPGIVGFAVDSKDNDKLIRPSKNESITEVINYQNLIVGKTYQITCTAYVQETGAQVPGLDGTAATKSIQLSPTDTSGSISVQLELDSSMLAGNTITVHTELISDDGTVLAIANNENSENEITVEPSIIASAQDALDMDNYVMGTDANVLECIEYIGLVPGAKYTVSCVLNDKATGNALRDAQGNIINAETEFIPTENIGHIDLLLPVDTSAIAGHDLVVFDKVFDAEGNIIASHQDLEDSNQTVKTVKLSSNAVDKSDGDKLFDSKSTSVCIVDTVNYANLVPGEQYEINGVLMDKETGCALMIEEEPVTAQVSFVPEEISGSVDVEYEFDASKQSSQVLVAYESVENNGNVIAQDADLEDVAQTVTSEDVDPETTTIADNETPLDGFGSPKMGDIILRYVIPTLAIISLCALAAGIVLHKRRRTLESIARTSELSE